MKFNHPRRHGDCVTRTVCVFRLEVGPSPSCPWTSKTSKVNHAGSNFSEYLLCSTNNVLNGILVSITYNTRIAPFIYFHYKEIKMLAILVESFVSNFPQVYRRKLFSHLIYLMLFYFLNMVKEFLQWSFCLLYCWSGACFMYESYEMLGVFFIENALYTNAIMLLCWQTQHLLKRPSKRYTCVGKLLPV